LLAQLREIQDKGWAVDDEENEVGVKCVGASIPDYQGRALAAISISANAARMTSLLLETLIPKLLQCKEDICRDMGL
jgi:DNA-binding IclR family transcriptional regulator